jgi:hypothetical protein
VQQGLESLAAWLLALLKGMALGYTLRRVAPIAVAYLRSMFSGRGR